MPYQLKLRSMLIASPGNVLVAVDFSQAETWIVAHKANEGKMIQSLMYGDIHTETAGNALFFNRVICNGHIGIHTWTKCKEGFECRGCGSVVTSDMRYLGKRFNHASSYQMKYLRAAEVINKDSDKPPYISISNSQARMYSDAWTSYYNLQPWWDGIENQLRIDRTLYNCYGRRMVFNGNWSDKLCKEATAWEPQSTVADHADGAIHPQLGIPGGFLEVHKQIVVRDRAAKIVNQSHDSIVLDTPKEVASEIGERVRSILRRPCVVNDMMFTIPVDLEIGDRYGELEKVA